MEEGKRMKRYRQKVRAGQPNTAQVHGGIILLDALVRATNHPLGGSLGSMGIQHAPVTKNHGGC